MRLAPEALQQLQSPQLAADASNQAFFCRQFAREALATLAPAAAASAAADGSGNGGAAGDDDNEERRNNAAAGVGVVGWVGLADPFGGAVVDEALLEWGLACAMSRSFGFRRSPGHGMVPLVDVSLVDTWRG